MENENKDEMMCSECDAAGITVELNIFGCCDVCNMYPNGDRMEVINGRHIVVRVGSV